MTDESIEAIWKSKLKELAELVGGKAWGADIGKPRIYLPAAKGRTVYVYFPDFPTGDDDEPFGGGVISVYIDACGQHPNWYHSQREREMKRRVWVSLTICAHNLQMDAEVVEKIRSIPWHELPEDLYSLDHALLNGKVEKATDIICSVYDEAVCGKI